MRKQQRKSLHLNRETLRHLTSARDLHAVRGGLTLTCTTCGVAGCGCVNTPDPNTNESCVCEENRDQP
jgi:hypothetical protein